MRVFYEEMKEKLQSILVKNGFDEKRAEESAKNFADSSLDGVYSHGYQRFPRVIDYIQKGYIDVNAVPEKITGFGAVERWDGHLGMGNLNAKMAMQRAVELAAQLGIGMVAMSNTNHWMRGGAYGWQAAEAGCIGICWTNTCPNMPAWGAIDGRIGNNPFVLAVPDQNGEHVVVDIAMAQYSYGKLSVCRQNGEKLPYPGGYDEEGSLTCDPEYGLTQVFIAIRPEVLNQDPDKAQEILNETLKDIQASIPEKEGHTVRYPGQGTLIRRRENLKNGIPVNEEIWKKICEL